MAHPLLTHLLDAAASRPPHVDGAVTFVPALDDGLEAVVAFTGHAVVASGLGAADLADLRPDGFGGALHPAVLLRLAGRGTIGVNDVTLVVRGSGAGSAVPRTSRWDHHARVAHAAGLRRNVEVFGDERGFFTLADGLAGRREMSIELDPSAQGRGMGRTLIGEAINATPPDLWLFAAVSPGNSRSLRAFLAAGFAPIGSEVIVSPER